MVGENQQAEVPFHFLSIDESQRLVSFNVPTRGCYRFSYLRQSRLMYLDMFIHFDIFGYDVFWYDLICVRYI